MKRTRFCFVFYCFLDRRYTKLLRLFPGNLPAMLFSTSSRVCNPGTITVKLCNLRVKNRDLSVLNLDPENGVEAAKKKTHEYPLKKNPS